MSRSSGTSTLPATLAAALTLAASLAWSASARALPGEDEASPAAEALARSPMPAVDVSRQAGLSRDPRWLGFQARHGAWSAWWNQATATAHRASGPPIALEGFAPESAAVDRAVRGFITRHPEQFLDPTLETMAVQRIGRVWYARYRQLLGGLPVLLSDWEFRVGVDGRLFLFGADAYRGVPAAARAARLPRGVARAVAERVPGFAAGDQVAGGERAFLLPVPGPAGIDFRPVYDFRVRTSAPPGFWAVMVDAVTGEPLQRQNLLRHAIDGHVSGAVHLTSPIQAMVSRPLPEHFVSVGSETTATDGDGHYALTASAGTLTAAVRGRFIDIRRADGPSAAFSAPVPGPGTYDIAWNNANSHYAERDAYYHLTLAHADVKRIDPGLVRLDRPVVCDVNLTDGVCNAYWDGYNLGFYPGNPPGGALAPCENSASTPGIVYHEYGHGIAYERYRQAANDTLVVPHNQVLSEGCAEANAMLALDDPILGREFHGPLTHQRTANQEARWPQDHSGTEYNTMFILTGSFWDLRTDAGKAVAEHLFHFAMYGLPDDPDDGLAMTEYFLETVVADDDDADLTNGTPHLDAILRAFNPRGLGTQYFFDFGHAPLGDQANAGAPLPVTATIHYSGALGAFDPSSPELVYSLNGAAWVTVAMLPTGVPDQFAATVPPSGGGVLRYYLRARDTFGGVSTWPIGAPAARPFALVSGSPAVVFADDMEIDRGWTVGATGDSATGGVWVRVDPIPTSFFDPVQPGDDHTPGAGALCWVTGNGTGGVNAFDVDRGRTTLTSPRLDATGVANPILEYYRWYYNRVITEPDTDPWRVMLSNDDGATWVLLENTTYSEGRWTRFLVRIGDVLTPTSQMRLRFQARDTLFNTTVEAAVDDVRLMGFAVTAVMLARFDAVPVDGAIEVRWRFGDASQSAAAMLERAPGAEGPWQAVGGEPRPDQGGWVVLDDDVEAGHTVFYRLVVADPGGQPTMFGPVTATVPPPVLALAVEEIVPNPTARTARIRFALPAAGHVRLSIFDVAGREVARLVDAPLAAGHHTRSWPALEQRAAAGVYYLELAAGGERRVRRLAVVR